MIYDLFRFGVLKIGFEKNAERERPVLPDGIFSNQKSQYG
jgi:hypothetical protein